MGNGTFFYVHGSGNRSADATMYGAKLRDGLGLPVGSDRLQVSTWGESRGPDMTFPLLDSVLPELPPALDEAIEAAAVDSLAPLRALADPDIALDEAVAISKPQAEQLLGILRAGIDLAEIGVSAASLRQAAAEVGASAEFATASAPEDQVIDATLRSVVARAIEIEPHPPGAEMDLGDLTARIRRGVGAIGQRLVGGTTSLVAGWFGIDLGREAKLVLSRHLAQRRNELTRRALPAPADVLSYQRRGGRIRDWVREELRNAEPPVVALGHSLGAIILVDTLFGPEAEDVGVGLLVTFGAQSAILAVTNAIDDVTPTIPWVNIWTPFDFISFLAGKVWPGKVTDVSIDVGVGFPDAHGAYYDTRAFFDVIKAQPAAATVLQGA